MPPHRPTATRASARARLTRSCASGRAARFTAPCGPTSIDEGTLGRRSSPPPPPRAPPFAVNRVLKIALPLLLFAASIFGWEAYVDRNQIPPYILPAPS